MRHQTKDAINEINPNEHAIKQGFIIELHDQSYDIS